MASDVDCQGTKFWILFLNQTHPGLLINLHHSSGMPAHCVHHQVQVVLAAIVQAELLLLVTTTMKAARLDAPAGRARPAMVAPGRALVAPRSHRLSQRQLSDVRIAAQAQTSQEAPATQQEDAASHYAGVWDSFAAKVQGASGLGV